LAELLVMVDWWTEVGRATSSFLDRHGLLAAFVFLLIEEGGVPVPVPGDVLMLILGVHARQGTVLLWQAVAVTWLGTMIGSTFLYFAARIAGRDLVYRYGRFIRLTPERLDKAERWLKQHGTRAVFLGRLVPGLRIVTAVACGVFEIPFSVFFPAMSLGALLYILVYTLLGFYLGQPVLDLLEKVHIPFGLLGSLVPLTLILLWTYRARQGLGRRTTAAFPVDRQQQLRAGAVAGGLATISSTLLFNVVINLAGNIAFSAPGTLVEQTAARLAFSVARELQPLLLFVAVPAFLGVGVLWGAMYALWLESRLPAHWPDWLKGMAFALVPFVVSLLVAMPLLGLGGFLGFGTTAPVVATGELIRHAAYGVQLGLLYPIFRTRRPVRVIAHTPDDVPPEHVASAGANP
jgi:membrane protein DedA with SNARE-associated domain